MTVMYTDKLTCPLMVKRHNHLHSFVSRNVISLLPFFGTDFTTVTELLTSEFL